MSLDLEKISQAEIKPGASYVLKCPAHLIESMMPELEKLIKMTKANFVILDERVQIVEIVQGVIKNESSKPEEKALLNSDNRS